MIGRSVATVYRGRLRGSAIGASIKVSVCEAIGLQHDTPGVRLRGFTFVGNPSPGADGLPDVIFDLVVRPPDWCHERISRWQKA